MAGVPGGEGAYGGWAPIGVEQVSGGYRVAWKLAGSDKYTVWSTDAGGNLVSNTGGISGSSATFQAYEPIFQQDLNGDGTIGLSAPTITAEIRSEERRVGKECRSRWSQYH